MKDCYIFDIDGTLSDTTHRQHFLQETPKNWDSFFAAGIDDKPIKHVCKIALLIHTSYLHVVYLTGRSDAFQHQTMTWLMQHVSLYATKIYMRNAADYRKDHSVNGEILDKPL